MIVPEKSPSWMASELLIFIHQRDRFPVQSRCNHPLRFSTFVCTRGIAPLFARLRARARTESVQVLHRPSDKASRTSSGYSALGIAAVLVRGSGVKPAANWIKSNSCSVTSRSRRLRVTSAANRSCAVQPTTGWASSRRTPNRRSGRLATIDRHLPTSQD